MRRVHLLRLCHRTHSPLPRRHYSSMPLTISAAPPHTPGAHWKGEQPNAFKNPWPSAKGEPPFSDVVKFMWGSLGKKAEPANFVTRTTPDFTPTTGVKATWLGHACIFLQIGTTNIIFDPVFESRCGPSQYFGAPKRFEDPACPLSDLPKIDVVVISHNHYDHLSLLSLKHIFKHNPDAGLFMPLNTGHITRGLAKPENERELDWWESLDVQVGQQTLKFTATPAQHMTARTTWDLAKSLWCSWVVEGDGKTVWFGGDTGYCAVDEETHEIDPSRPVCPAFKEIGERFDIDLAFIPIGAYAARSFLSTVHCAPIDSVRLFRDIKAKKAVAIHWGTWDLSHEPISEPPRLLAKARKQLDIAQEEFDIIALGGSIAA